MKNLHERFSSIDLLNYLFTKLGFIFHAQQYLIEILRDVHKRSRMVAALGREGMGKSSAIAKYVQENDHVYYVRVGTTYSLSNLFDEMLFQVTGIYPLVTETLFVKMKKLSHALTTDNAKRLMILDDATRLSPRGLSVCIELRDNTIATTGVVFVGLSDFQKKLLNAKKLGVPGIAEFYRRIENWYVIPGLMKNEIPAYGLQRGLTQEQLFELENAGLETIAELENMTNAILEEAEDAKKEERAPKKVNVPGKAIQADKSRPAVPSKEDDEDEEDELEEKLAQEKKEAAKKARDAKKAKSKTKQTTSDAASA